MTALTPTRYSSEPNSTFFEVAGSLISVHYEVIDRTRYFVQRLPSLARVTVRIDDGASELSHQYTISASRRIGGEIGSVERGLYAFMDEVAREAMQIRALQKTEKEMRALEAEHLYGEGTGGSDRPIAPRRQPEVRKSAEESALGELATRLITAVSHVTALTSLTRAGLDSHQRERTAVLESVLKSTSPAALQRVQGVLEAVESFLHYDVEFGTDLKTLQKRTSEHLALIQRRQAGRTSPVSEEQAGLIVDEFVPAYVAIRKKHDTAVRMPSDIVAHACGSFFAGGFAGYVSLSLFGEAVIQGLTGIPVDIPGWWIGAATAFGWPYVKATYGVLTREKRLAKERDVLLQRTSVRLQRGSRGEALPPPSTA